jgi:hypothetical protein
MYNEKGVVVDLDGTLLSVNTFQKYIVFSFREAIKAFHFFIAFKIIFFVVCRKFRFIKHEVMKFHILNLTNSYLTKSDIVKFSSTLLNRTNIDILNILKDYKKRNYIISLSTAAPMIYVDELVTLFPLTFDIVCCTPMPSTKISWHENVRQMKSNNTISSLKNRNVTLNVLITDHFDDIPLLSIEKDLNLIVNPSKQTIRKLKKQNIKYSIL